MIRIFGKLEIDDAVRRRMTASAVLAVTLTSTLPAFGACSDLARSLRSALAEQDLEAARRHHEAVWRETSCDDGFRARAGRAVSLLHARIVQERVAAGESLASQRPLLEQGLEHARSWPVLALLGDVAHDTRRYDDAAAFYQEALTAIDDPVETPKAPPEAEIERIFDRAALTRMLASTYRPSPITRSGAPGGLAATSIRGFRIERVPVPVTFHTGTADFTAKGDAAARDLLEQLGAEQPAGITLAGHTDPRGTESYNLDLSRRRAEAVARYLRVAGFTGRVEIVAKGESERFPLEDPAAYTREERWQMDRRVELIR